jgi:hypothetical protein
MRERSERDGGRAPDLEYSITIRDPPCTLLWSVYLLGAAPKR